MPFCPRCGRLVQEDALYCPNCGASLTEPPQPTQPTAVPPHLPSRPPSYSPEKDAIGRFVTLGYISCVLSLIIMPEVFGSLAIFFGNYVRRRGQGNRVFILGIICMFVGLFFTAFFSLLDLLP